MDTLKFLAKSLFSNNEIIQKAKAKKFWLALLIMVLSLIIAIIPTFTSIINVNGGSIVTSNSQTQFDYSLQRLSHEYLNGENGKLSFEIVNGKLNVKEGKAIKDLQEKKIVTLENGEELAYLEIKQTLSSESLITLLVAQVNYEDNETNYKNVSAKINDTFNHLAANYPINNTENQSSVYSTMLFTNDAVYVRLYQSGAKTNFVKDGNKIKLSSTTSITSSMQGLLKDVSTQHSNLNDFDNVDSNKILTNWTNFFNEGYSKLKTTTLMLNCSAYSGLNLIVILFVSLTLFIMSRFKTSTCGKLSYVSCLKYISFASLSPAIITLILGSMIPTLQAMGFLFCLAMRSIFLSSKLTRAPEATTPNK